MIPVVTLEFKSRRLWVSLGTPDFGIATSAIFVTSDGCSASTMSCTLLSANAFHTSASIVSASSRSVVDMLAMPASRAAMRYFITATSVM